MVSEISKTLIDSKRTNSFEKRIKVGLVSCGLGRVNRGYEVSTARLYRAIKERPELDVKLFTGAKFEDGIPIPNAPRDFLLNTILKLASLVNKRRVWEFAYGIEQITYAFGLLGQLLSWQPDIIWTKEAPCAHVLWFLRNLLQLKFKIVFANGGGFRPPTYELFDYIQHLQSKSYQDAIEHGIAPNKMQVLPNVLPFIETPLSRQAARESFGYKDTDWVVICVAAWNRYHKRIDYLIEEVAGMKDANVHLLLCGHPEPDSGSLKSLGKKKLGKKIQWHTLPENEIPCALKASDVFVLASTHELFGSASVEAVMAGVPIIAHPNGASSILADFGFKATNLSNKGALTNKLKELKKEPPHPEKLKELANATQKRFSKETVVKEFVLMMQSLTASTSS